MAGERSLPQVPLSHADGAAHRRLLAERANAIGFEFGEILPTLDFDTTGDLSNAYTTQDGYYWRIGPLVHFHVHLVVTPTFTTASGAFKVEGMPYPLKGGPNHCIFPVRLGGTGITWPHNDVVAFMRADEDWLEFAFQGSGVAGQNFAASDITTATQASLFITGFYPMADRA